MKSAAEQPSTPAERGVHSPELARRHIGVIGPFTSNNEIARQLAGILRTAAGSNDEIAVFDQVSGAIAPLHGLPLEHRVDGVLILSVPIDDETELLLRQHAIPAVQVDLDDPRLSSIVLDHRRAGSAAGEFFLKRGHERIAYVGHQQAHDFDSQSRQKLEGLARVLPVAPEVHNTDLSLEAAVEAGRQMLSDRTPPTAVFTHTDSLAAGVLTAARELGVDVPNDLSIIGFNDTEIAELMQISTFHQPFEEAGSMAMRVLTDLLDSPGPRERRAVTLVPDLVERSTT